MILRKPYAFFIKMFKPIHIILSILLIYLIYLQNKILTFLSSYISNISVVVDENIVNELITNKIYIIPIILILFSLLILGIMFKKKKSVMFYFINIILCIIVIVINVYALNFLEILKDTIVAIKTVKLIRDFVFLGILIESVSLIFFITRGMGLNIKKFNFDSEFSKININESDKEEFEVNLNVDFNERKRRLRQRLRYLKYRYVENKFIINCVIFLIVIIVSVLIYLYIQNKNNYNKEGISYNINNFDLIVNDTNIIKNDYRGNKITDDYLIVVNLSLRSFFTNKNIYSNDFSLKIEDLKFKSITKYSSSLIDMGITYEQQNLTSEYTSYIFVYEIPEKYINSDMELVYTAEGEEIVVRLEPQNFKEQTNKITKNITEEIDFSEYFENIKFLINNYEINDFFVVNYNYCVSTNDCMSSLERLVPSIDENFDKTVLKLNVEYNNNSSLDVSNFYTFLNNFGSIEYAIDDTIYKQNSLLEEIKSKKKQEKNVVYVGVNERIKLASSIKLVFDIRGISYEYVLK